MLSNESLFYNFSLREMFKHGLFSGLYFPAFVLNTERYGVSPYSVRMRENTNLEKLRNWRLHTVSIRTTDSFTAAFLLSIYLSIYLSIRLSRLDVIVSLSSEDDM